MSLSSGLSSNLSTDPLLLSCKAANIFERPLLQARHDTATTALLICLVCDLDQCTRQDLDGLLEEHEPMVVALAHAGHTYSEPCAQTVT